MRVTLSALALGAMVAFEPYSAFAEPLRVFTTVPDLAAIAREVGGDRVETFSAVAGPEDPHFAEARPSYIKELSRADVYIQVGMELEIGYAENLLRNARNAKVLPGAPGHIVAAEAVTPLGVPSGPISRALGDVHGAGSPHFLVDPLSGLAVAELIRERLATIRPDDAAYFAERTAAFRAEVGKRLVDWRELLASHPGAKVVDDHPIWLYFARTFGLDVVAHLEPKPGIQPTTAHLKQVIEQMKADDVRVLLQAAYYDDRHARFVADATGASIAKLAHQVGALPGTASYLEMIDYNVRAVARALESTKTPSVDSVP